jgi:hypothetical protein
MIHSTWTRCWPQRPGHGRQHRAGMTEQQLPPRAAVNWLTAVAHATSRPRSGTRTHTFRRRPASNWHMDGLAGAAHCGPRPETCRAICTGSWNPADSARRGDPADPCATQAAARMTVGVGWMRSVSRAGPMFCTTAAPEVFAASQAFFRPRRSGGRTGQRPEEPRPGGDAAAGRPPGVAALSRLSTPCVQQLGQQRTPLMPALGAGQTPQRAAPLYERTAPRWLGGEVANR